MNPMTHIVSPLAVAAALLFAACTGQQASPKQGAAPQPQQQAPSNLKLEDVAGVYKYSFQNGLYNGVLPNGELKVDHYTSENVLELVPYGDSAMYISTRLSFFNGHGCRFTGIAKRYGDVLIHKASNQPNACEMHINLTSPTLTLQDVGKNCKFFCGARGGFGGERFTPAQRRPITYMQRLLNSPEYKAAVTNYQQSQTSGN